MFSEIICTLIFTLFLLICISLAVCFWIYFVRESTILKKGKDIVTLKLNATLTIEELMEKMKAELDYPEANKFYYDEKVRIVVECEYATNLIYIKDDMIHIAPQCSSSKRTYIKNIENVAILKKCIEKMLDHTAPINVVNELSSFRAERDKVLMIKIIAPMCTAFFTYFFTLISFLHLFWWVALNS